jgi:prolyl oligopeptidase
LQNQNVLYRHLNDESSKNAKVFLDPNSFKSDGTISLGNISFSKNSKFLAYSISEGGSDWRKIIVMDLKRNEVLKDTLVDVKFSGISWYKDEGFYYSSYDKPKGSVLSSKTDQHKLFYHKIGTNQSDDLLIYGMAKDQKNRYINASVTDDDRYLIISASISTSGNKLLFKDLVKPDSDFVSIIDNYNSDSYLLDNVGSTFYVVTNLDAPNQKIVSFEADTPDQMNWNDIIPEREHVLNPSSVGGYFFAEYMVDAISRVEQYDYQGNFIRNLKLPGIGSVNGFGGKRSDKIDFYSFTNYKTPPSIFSIDVETGVSKLYWQPKIDFNPNDYESKAGFLQFK